MSDYTFKVGLVGPSRIGKTTLVAAVFEQGRQLLQGLPIHLEAAPKTQRALKQNHNAIEAAVAAGRFNPDSLRGTQGAFTYELSFSHKGETFHLHALDFPGRWLTDDPERWRSECDPWISESPVLLVPTDATLLMEPATASQYLSARDALGVFEARDVMAKWAKAIKESGQPALLAFVPLKTETYYADNGGQRRDAETLRHRFDEIYGPFIKDVRAELGDHAPNVRIEYHPVDSLGCVDLQRIDWKGDVPAATFEVRRGQVYCPRGADDLLSSILRIPFQHVHVDKDRRVAEVEGELNRERGFFGGFWYWATGEKSRATRRAEGLERERADLLAALEEIAARPQGTRVDILDG